MKRPVDPRPLLAPALETLLDDVVAQVPRFSGLRAREILVVALAAHGDVVASIRALSGCAKSVTVEARKRTSELGLRPAFFLEGDASRRLATLIHELLHLDVDAPGRLFDANRHARRSHAAHEREARALAKSYLARADPTLLLCLAHHGEVLMRHWTRRPIESTVRRAFTDVDVHVGPLRMETPAHARGTWW